MFHYEILSMKHWNVDEKSKFQLKAGSSQKSSVFVASFDLPFKGTSVIAIKWLKIELLMDISTFYSSATCQFQ